MKNRFFSRLVLTLALLTAVVSSVSVAQAAIQAPDAIVYQLNQKKAAQARTDAAAADYYLRPSKDIQSDNKQIIALAQELTDGLDDDYNKVRAIHDWVCNHIYYDYDAYYKRAPYGDNSALGVLDLRQGVCAGYTRLSVALLRAAGIPARYVAGYAVGSPSEYPSDVLNNTATKTNHAWTEALVNGRWLTFDSTWDSGNAWEYGCVSKSAGCTGYRYFDPDPAFFAQTHAVLDGNYYREIYLYMNYPQYWTGEWNPFDTAGTAPTAFNGTTMVPIRALIEEMGGNVTWDPFIDPGWNKITCNVNGFNIQLWIGYPIFYVDGTEYRFDIPPQSSGGTSVVQIRPLLEAIDCVVLWDSWADGWPGRITVRYTT